MGEFAAVRIFDTTVRDGGRSSGTPLSLQEKLHIVDQLIRLNVDCIEAGFPAASPDEFTTVKEIARKVRGASVAALAGATSRDIEVAWDAVCEAERPMIYVFMATSDIHLKHRLHLDREEALQRVKTMVSYAHHLCPTVGFCAEDATRSDWDYLCRVCEVAIQAGTTTISIPDTVGYTLPQEYEALFRYLYERVPGIEKVVMSAHCHDDLGMATANALAAIKAGARQVEVTLNGVGEQAGNTAMEEIVVALRVRPEMFDHLDTRIHAHELLPASQQISHITGIPVLPNKAIVGAHSLTLETAMQQHDMKTVASSEMPAPSVERNEAGLSRDMFSAPADLDAHLRLLGYRLTADELTIAYQRFVTFADDRPQITTADLMYIAESSIQTPAAI